MSSTNRLAVLAVLGCLLAGPRGSLALQDVTADLFGSENYGTVAAFGDFNSDKQTDIFVIREQSELVIFLADLKIPYFKPKVNITRDYLPRDSVITSVVPGDYDGDSQMDVLLTTNPKLERETTVFIFWGNNQTLEPGGRLELNKTFIDQPLVMDFNGDMIPDIFGVMKDGSTEVCFLQDRVLEWHKALNGPAIKMRTPHSNAFIDLNMDFTAGCVYVPPPPRRQQRDLATVRLWEAGGFSVEREDREMWSNAFSWPLLSDLCSGLRRNRLTNKGHWTRDPGPCVPPL
ncbi:unnamed protein product [Merluccius merluccius]